MLPMGNSLVGTVGRVASTSILGDGDELVQGLPAGVGLVNMVSPYASQLPTVAPVHDVNCMTGCGCVLPGYLLRVREVVGRA